MSSRGGSQKSSRQSKSSSSSKSGGASKSAGKGKKLEGGLAKATATLAARDGDCSGYLLKLPVEKVGSAPKTPINIRGRWQRRWFTLRGRTLEYKTDQSSRGKPAKFELSGKVTLSELDNKLLTFDIRSEAGKVQLKAETRADKHKWFCALAYVSEIRTMTDQGLEDNSPPGQKWKPSATAKPLVDYKHRSAKLRLTSGIYLLTVPVLVKDLVDWLTKYGLQHEGMFRVPAEAKSVRGFLRAYHEREEDEGRRARLLDSLKGDSDVDLVAGTLKKCLRELPAEPLIPVVHYEQLIQLATEIRTDPTRVKRKVAEELEEMNRTHLHALLYLLGFCVTLAKSSKANKMKPYNIAVCLAPTILCKQRGNNGDTGAQSELKEMPQVLKIVEFLIEHLEFLAAHLDIDELETVDEHGNVTGMSDWTVMQDVLKKSLTGKEKGGNWGKLAAGFLLGAEKTDNVLPTHTDSDSGTEGDSMSGANTDDEEIDFTIRESRSATMLLKFADLWAEDGGTPRRSPGSKSQAVHEAWRGAAPQPLASDATVVFNPRLNVQTLKRPLELRQAVGGSDWQGADDAGAGLGQPYRGGFGNDPQDDVDI